MKNKKLISMVVAIALVAVIGVGATLAYFTDKEETTNVITMGHVDIDLDEPNYEGDDNNEVKDIEPGQKITKDPTITVAEGSQDAYVRATIAYGNLTDAQIADLAIEINDGWYFNEEDGYYYFNAKLAAGESATLFDKVVIPETWGNDEADLSFTITVNAEAIQADNFEPTWNADNTLIVAWTYSDGTAIEAETYEAKAE